MRRLLAVSLALGLLVAGTFLVSFTFSRYRVKGQGYLTSLDDFVFMLDTYRRQSFELPPPAFSEPRYESVMRRFRRHTHNEVERRAVWRLARWGERALPDLVKELASEVPAQRREGAARALGAIGGPAAVAALEDWLCSLPRAPGPPVRRQVRVAIVALGETREPAAAEVLGRCAAERVDADEIDVDTYLRALARSGGGVDLLLERFRGGDAETVQRILWELAETRDPLVAEAMAPLLAHPLGKIRQRTRDALDQSMGPAAIDPVLDVLESEEDGYVASAILRHLLDDADAREHPAVVPVLTRFASHPALGGDALYALARNGTPEAVASLRRHARIDPEAVLSQMDMMGEEALPIVADLLESPDPRVRWKAVDAAWQIYTPGARPLVMGLRDDPVPYVAREAASVLARLDKVDLHASWAAALPGDLARQAWYAFRPDFFGHDRGVESMWPVLTWLHWAGVALSAILALLLVFRVVSVFEPYRFQLFVTFLLVEGFVGDFFFMDQGPDPWTRYQGATAVHLALLIGFLCFPRDVVPGELRGRLETLGGASVWILIPLLLVVGTPLVATALRRSLADFGNMRYWLWLLAALTILVFEQWLVPWHLFPRRARVERIVRGALSSLLLALVALALVAHSGSLRLAGDTDGALMAMLLVLPLVFVLLVHLHCLGFLRHQGRPPARVTPPGRLRALQDGESVRIRREASRTRLVRVLRVALVVGPAFVAGVVSGGSGKASGMLLAFVAAPLGAALGALAFLLLEAPFVVHVRRGWMRSATTLLGASIGRAGWRRRVARAEVRGRVQSKWGDLSQDETRWLLDVVAGGTGAAPRASAYGARLALELRLGPPGDPQSGLVPLRLRVTNEGEAPVSPADVDDRAGGFSWCGRADDERLPLYIARAEREAPIPAGGRVVLHPRVDLGRVRAAAVEVRVSCPAGTSNAVRVETPGGSA